MTNINYSLYYYEFNVITQLSLSRYLTRNCQHPTSYMSKFFLIFTVLSSDKKKMFIVYDEYFK